MVRPAGSSQSLTRAAISSSPRPRARASENRCSASAPRSSGTQRFLASSWISARALKITRTGAAGLEAGWPAGDWRVEEVCTPGFELFGAALVQARADSRVVDEGLSRSGGPRQLGVYRLD